ncbi:MAG: metallophosphoesterase family protein [Vicinamibacterales bacterium]
MTIGVISDTHGLLRPQALEALQGSDLILHAGDVGPLAILDALGAIAPTIAVRGNVDTAVWATTLRETEVIAAERCSIVMVHDRARLAVDPRAAGHAAVVFGHSHRPLVETRQGVLFVNPGSAGPRRFDLPVTVAQLTVSGDRLEAAIVPLRV